MDLYRAYLFDLDGTLIDTAPDLMAALNHTLESAGYPKADMTLTRHWVGHGAKVMIHEAISHFGSASVDESELDDLYEVFLGHYRSSISRFSSPYPTVVDTLNYLHERVGRMAVVTNKKADLSIQLLKELDLYQLFHVVVGGDTLSVSKPRAEPALYACNELDTVPEATLFVGDSVTDVQCARAAGCPVFVLQDGYNHGMDPHSLGADRVIQTFAELIPDG